MKKKLLAVAVVGAFALPGAALAQSSVTISGFLKGGFESLSYGNYVRATGGNSSQTGVVDDSSRIIFNVREDLGGGLAAIGQVDVRIGLDTGNIAASGNNHVGLVSKNWGRIFIGRQDLHYFNRESELTVRGSLRADSISLLAFAGTGAIAIAGATRTANVVHYTTPNWNGFTVIGAYSSNATGVESDIGVTNRKGRAWNFNPNWAQKNFQIGYSYWSSKVDGASAIPAVAGTVSAAAVATAPTAAALAAGGAAALLALGNAADQRGDRLYGSYTWGGLKVGLAWDKSKLKIGVPQSGGGVAQFLGGQVATGTVISNRTAWSIPVQYTWGNHGVYGHYTKARDDKATPGVADGAKMFALSYAYNLSKRTSLSLTYAKVTNDVGATYQPFTSAALGLGAGTPGSATTGSIAAGEDPRMWGVTMRHAF